MNENIFSLIFWLIVISIWLFSNLLKKKQPTADRKPEEKLKDIFKTLGFPVPEIPQSQQENIPKPEIKPSTYIVDKEKELKKVLKEKFKKTVQTPPEIATAEKEKPPLDFSLDKLKEGIILSVLLGPPKAKTYKTQQRL